MKHLPSLVCLLALAASALAAAPPGPDPAPVTPALQPKTAPHPESLYIETCQQAEADLAAIRNAANAADWPRAAQAALKALAEHGASLIQLEATGSAATPSERHGQDVGSTTEKHGQDARATTFVPFADQLHRIIRSWPEPGLRAFAAACGSTGSPPRAGSRGGPSADEACARAIAARSLPALDRVARLYLPAPAGLRALAAAADLRLQLGQLRSALALLDRLLELAPASGPLHDSAAAKLAAVRTALQSVPPPGPEAASPDWPALAGGPARRNAAPPTPSPFTAPATPSPSSAPATPSPFQGEGRVRVPPSAPSTPSTPSIASTWTFDLPDPDIDAATAARRAERGLRVPHITVPVVSRGRVFVQTTQSLLALDLATGRRLWQYPPHPTAPDGGDCFDALASPAADGNRVFTVLGDQLAALDAATGTPAWTVRLSVNDDTDQASSKSTKPAANLLQPAAHSLQPEILVNSLAVADGTVFLCATALKQESECFALAFDTHTGAALWRRKLCSHVFDGLLGRGSHPAPPAADEGSVYLSTNLGAVAALDAETGSVRWLTRYPAFEPARRRTALATDQTWNNNPPAVAGALLIAAPQDSDDVIAFDIATGRIVWRYPRNGLRHLAGVARGRVLLSGSCAAALDLATGKPLWFTGSGWQPAGRPVLAGDTLLVPTEQAVIAIDAAAGRQTSAYRLTGPRERGNLVLAGDLLLSASFDRVVACTPPPQAAAGGDSPAARLAEARRLARLGDLIGALRLYKLALAPEDDTRGVPVAERKELLDEMSAAQLDLGRQLLDAGRPGEGENALILAARYARSPRAGAAASLAVAECRERMGNWKEAAAAYRHAAEQYGRETADLHGVSVPVAELARSRIERILENPAAKAAGIDPPPVPPLGTPEPVELWRTPADSAHADPVILGTPPGAARLPSTGSGRELVERSSPKSGDAVLLATRDLGSAHDPADGRASVYDSLECRRLIDGSLRWRTVLGEFLPQELHAGNKVLIRGIARLIAIDPTTGRVDWSAATALKPAEADRIVAFAVQGSSRPDRANLAFAATAGRDIIAWNLDSGKERWRRKLADPILADSLSVVGDKLLVLSENPGTLTWLNASTGEVAARVVLDRRDNRITDPPVPLSLPGRWQGGGLHPTHIAIVLGDREVRACDLASGKTLWKAETPFAIGRIAASPDERLLLVFPDRFSFGGKTTALDAATGKRLWQTATGSREPGVPLITSRFLVCPATASLAAFHLTDGSLAWRAPLPQPIEITRLARVGGLIIASGSADTPDGRIAVATILNHETGAIVQTLLRHTRQLIPAAVAGAWLLASGRNVEAWRLQPEGSALAALIRLLDRPPDPAAALGSPDLTRLGRLLAQHGDFEAAMSRLDAALLAESPDPAAFARSHEQLAAIRETAAEHIVPTYETPRFRRAPKIDGRLAEDWRPDRAARLDRPRFIERIQSMDSTPLSWTGPADLSAALYLGWDAEHLYLAVDVNDDVHTAHDFESPAWKGDCLLVAIDPECDGGYKLNGNDILFWIGLAAKPQHPKDGQDRLAGLHEARLKDDGSGLVYELALPWSDLGIARPGPGMKLGLNILVIDDDGRGPLKAITWTPGLTQNLNRRIMTRDITPARFGTVILKER